MNDIKVGEYVRTKYGIRQIIHIIDDKLYQVDGSIALVDKEVTYWASSVKRKEIEKHSESIIDLIEVGDYVNGMKIIATENRCDDKGTKVILAENYDEWTDNGVIHNEEIKDIVTHEQFNSIKYVLGGKEE